MPLYGETSFTVPTNFQHGEEWSHGGSKAIMPVDVSWSSRKTLMRDVMGYPWLDGTTLRRRVPMRHPYMDWLFCVGGSLVNQWNSRSSTDPAWVFDASEDNLDPDVNITKSGHAQYGDARIILNFQSLPYAVRGDGYIDEEIAGGDNGAELKRFVERKQNLTVESASFGPGAWVWEGTAVPAAQSPPQKLFGSREMTYIWHQVPGSSGLMNSTLDANISALLGKINNAEWDGHPAGTMLFAGVKVDTAPMELGWTRRANGGDGTVLNISYRFVKRDNGDVGGGARAGHNYFWRPSSAAFERIETSNGSGQYVYDSDDFSYLFRFAAIP